jgi:hypothetical protein
MKRILLLLLALPACATEKPAEKYGFIALLGNDTVSVESVTRVGNKLTSDEVDRFPRVNQRHTEITLDDDGSISHLVMDIHTPSESVKQRDRHVSADVTSNEIKLSKRDSSGTINKTFPTGVYSAVAHVPQMYSLYEIYFAAAMKQANSSKLQPGDTIKLRQFYIDREFDNFPLHRAFVRLLPNGKAEIWHDWLSGHGDAALDTAGHLLSYSGARSTYKVEVTRLSQIPDVKSIGERFAALEENTGGVRQLSVRDTARGSIGSSQFTVDYGRPLARGRVLLGNILPFDRVWRTGANAATQFTASAPITLAGLAVPAGKYTLWTVPHTSGVELIVNKQSGQWGTQYAGSMDLGKAPMKTERLSTPVEKFTISINPADAHHGSLIMEWGDFRWTAPIIVR